MNEPSTLFKQLVGLFAHDPCSEHIDVLSADLAARLAGSNAVCVGVVKSGSLRHYFNVVLILKGFGICARTRRLERENGYVIFLEIDRTEPESEWAEATCRAVTVRAPRQLAAAWA